MSKSRTQELQQRYLQKLYELAEGNLIKAVSTDQLETELGISDEEGTNIIMYLSSKNLAELSSFGNVNITPRGIDTVEAAMQSSYAEKEREVLKKIYEMGGVRHIDWVVIDHLVKQLGMDYREVNTILIDLEERKGLIEGTELAVKMKPAGIEEVEAMGRHPERATANFPPSITNYTTNIQGHNYGGIQQGGQGHVQNVTLTNNPDFDKAIGSLVELIRSSSLPEDEKEELQQEVQSVNKLALKEQTPNTIERAKLKLDYLKTALTATDIAMKAMPYFPALYNFFQSLPT